MNLGSASSLKINFLRKARAEYSAIGDLCRARGPWRGRAFKRRFVGGAEAHFHAKRLTSEHLLLLNAFLSPGGGSHVELEELILERGVQDLLARVHRRHCPLPDPEQTLQ